MTKYLFYILACVMLALNLSDTPNRVLLESQGESIVSDTEAFPYTESFCNISASQECSGAASRSSSGDYKVCKDVLPGVSGLRGQTILRLLKISANPAIVGMRDFFETQLPLSKYKNLLSQNNPAKFSCRYYLYTLRKILI